MLKQHSKEIDGVTYYVTQVGARKVLSFQTQLIRLFGEKLLYIVASNTGTVEEKLIAALPTVLKEFDAEGVEKLIDLLFERNVFVDSDKGKEVLDFDTYFVNKPFSIWKVAIFIIEANFNVGELLKSISPTKEADGVKREN
jgi:hypothetical protein